jgi:type II secretory pathway predicted ATPase ExeA
MSFPTDFWSSLDAAAPLTFILVGQAELRGMLRLKAFEAILQRLQMRYHLTGLDNSVWFLAVNWT